LEPTGEQSLRFGPSPITFIGAPSRCMGIVEINNPFGRAVKLRRMCLRMPGTNVRIGCESSDTAEVQVSARLCARSTEQVRVLLRLPPGTPPGSYDAQLSMGAPCSPAPNPDPGGGDDGDGDGGPVITIRSATFGGDTHDAKVHVTELRRTRLSPQSFTCSPEPDSDLEFFVTAQNLGNVPVIIPKHAALEFHDADQGWPHHAHVVAKAHAENGYGDFLDNFVKRVGEHEPPVGKAKILEGDGELAPQQSRLLKLKLHFPKKLKHGARYQGSVRIADTSLRLMVHVVPEP
jgi:hypothetical protein